MTPGIPQKLLAGIEVPQDVFNEAYDKIQSLYNDLELDEFLAMMAINYVLSGSLIEEKLAEIIEDDENV